MSKRYAQVLVFVTSGAVLVLEILAGRLLAPYIGVSLETFTGIIGTILAGIALGSALGGRLADQHDPAKLIGPAMIVGGVLSWLSLPIVSFLGPGFGSAVPAIIALAFFGFFAPAMVLSAVSPMVAKLRLESLDQTGEVVGGLSAAGTVGALFGTFFTGFVLVAAAPTRPVIIVLGIGLVIWGLVFSLRRGGDRPTVGAVVSVLGALGLSLTSFNPCDFESAYACGRVVIDDEDESLRFLILDTVRHGAVDLDDRTHLEFRYTSIIGDVIDSMPDGPLRGLHLGGGAFSVPEFVNQTRPGSSNLVLEIDPLLVEVATDELGLVTGPDLEVVTGDARLALGDLETDSFDLIVGDAFAGASIPWHLTTTEFIAELDRVLTDDGLYVMNVIDGRENRFSEAGWPRSRCTLIIGPPSSPRIGQGRPPAIRSSSPPTARCRTLLSMAIAVCWSMTSLLSPAMHRYCGTTSPRSIKWPPILVDAYARCRPETIDGPRPNIGIAREQ